MARDIRGTTLQQNSLQSDLTGYVAGQQPLTKNLLILFIGLVTLLTGFLAGLRGAASSLGLVSNGSDTAYKVEVGLALLTEIIWLITATFGDFSKSLIPIACSLVLGIVLVMFNLVGNLDLVFLLITILAGVAITALSYVLIRMLFAIGDILLNRSRLLKILMFPVIVMAAIAGALVVATGETETGELPSNQVFIAIVSSVVFGLFVALIAFLANHRQGVPWRHPDFFRSLALAIASWRGTSFHNLDLSLVCLQNAHLANTDLRAKKLYRTSLQGVIGLERARVDSRYLDLENTKVQKLLTHATSDERDYNQLNLRGAYLQHADLRRFSFIDTDLSGADLSDADLRGAILARTQAIGADFSNADLTGICIKDWSVNDQTIFSNAVCDYVYRELDEKGEPTDRYPADRNFEPEEFESLYQEMSNVAELIFKEGVNWRAFSFSMQKLEVEDDGLGLELKGFERRGDRWVVRVTHNQHVPKQEVERRLTDMYEDMKGLLAAKEDQINKLLGIASDQAEALKEISQKPFGNSFFITGSTITNLTGSGNIEYNDVASQVRTMVTSTSDPNKIVSVTRNFVQQLKSEEVATTAASQLELIQQVILAEAETDPQFKQYLLQQGSEIVRIMGGQKGSALATAIQGAIAQL